MPSTLDQTGLTIETLPNIVLDITAGLIGAYGSGINTNSNTPDGQMINIYAQTSYDQLQLLALVYNSFSVENAIGVYLDQRVALNGLQRAGETYTIITVTFTASMDAILPAGYTLTDSLSQSWVIITPQTVTDLGATIQFQGTVSGTITTPIGGTLTQVTPVTGILTTVTAAIVYPGQDEETDTQLKIRRNQSFYLGSVGPADSVLAQLLATPGISGAYVIENATGSTVNGVPAYNIWCIVQGGTPASIGQAIYLTKSLGTPTFGGSSYVYTRPNGQTITINYDVALSQPLYIEFGITPRYPGITFDETLIAEQLAEALSYTINQQATIQDVLVAMLTIAPQAILTGTQVSINNSAWFDTVATTSPQYYFTVLPGNITFL